MKILLVEDSATIRYAMCNYIQDAGHDTVVAESGEQALQILENTPVDMVIMDVEMPGLDGFETTRLIREWLGDHWIPIIFVTGKSDAKSLEQGIAAGGDDYLIKPINQIILNAKIRAMERITEMRDQLASLNRELTILSQRDGLTHLYNRRTFEEKAAEAWAQSTREKTPISILLLDIDHFKLYNDRYGHQAGDECIRQVAKVLNDCLHRSTDLVGRYGGEEFVALLANTPERGARHISELIRIGVEELGIRHGDSTTSHVVTVSIGVSVVNFTTGTDLNYQIDRADKALYESKQRGRNCATVKEFNPERKVLLVDENEAYLEETADMLKGHCTVVTSSHPEEYVALAEEYRAELVILDVVPDDQHRELCLALRKNATTQTLPLLLVSSCPAVDLTDFAIEVNACGVLQKPVNENRLIASLNKFLQ